MPRNKARLHYKAIREKGLCGHCQKRPARPERAYCADCIQLRKQRRLARLQALEAQGLCRACGKTPAARGRKSCADCLAKKRGKNHRYKTQRDKYMREWYKRLRAEVFEAYGGAVCACCNEDEVGFLSIDHIHGGGTAHRAQVGMGSNFYRWLKNEGFPTGYQVLCQNCNFAKGKRGRRSQCPHQKERTS